MVTVLIGRFSGDGVSWWLALLVGLVATPLVLWMWWLRRRITGQAAVRGRRHGAHPWPEDRQRAR
ncbi:hypothetical protein STBA_02740 [Streptomyces sp. MP131-18]|nr:hypothetical protein STBA_02740 [Streptomyces sp. MP131-18]